jgi:hypothetical protein
MDYVEKLLDVNGIDVDIFKQVNDWFEIDKSQLGYSIKTIYDFNIGTNADPYVIYYLYNIMVDSRCMETHLDVIGSSNFKYWSYENKKVMYKIRASNYITKQLAYEFKQFERDIRLLPNNAFLENNNNMIFTWPTLKNVNWELEKLNGYVKNNYKCKTQIEFKDMREIYIQKEMDRRELLFGELDKYLMENDIKKIFDVIIDNVCVMIDMDNVKPIEIVGLLGKKCNIEGHNIREFLRYQDKLFFDEVDIKKFALYDRNAIMATFFVKKSLFEFKKLLSIGGPVMCEILLNNIRMDNELKQTFMMVNKYFNNLVKNVNVVFDNNYRVGCKEGCGNKILILKGSVMCCLPKCNECIEHKKIKCMKLVFYPGDYWARCNKCLCLYWIASYGGYLDCQICYPKK